MAESAMPSKSTGNVAQLAEQRIQSAESAMPCKSTDSISEVPRCEAVCVLCARKSVRLKRKRVRQEKSVRLKRKEKDGRKALGLAVRTAIGVVSFAIRVCCWDMF